MIELVEKCEGGEPRETLTLPFEKRQRSRQRVKLDSGGEAAVVLPTGTSLAAGDRLRALDGTVVLVVAAREPVVTARCDDPVRLARASYHLGNRHVAVQVGDGWLRYQPDHVLDEMVQGLGLNLSYGHECFEPERGAYSGSSHSHAQPHSHGADEPSHGHPH